MRVTFSHECIFYIIFNIHLFIFLFFQSFPTPGFNDGEFDFSSVSSNGAASVMVGSTGMVQQAVSPGINTDYNGPHGVAMNGQQQGMGAHPGMYNGVSHLAVNPKNCTLNGIHQSPPNMQTGFMNHDPISPMFPPQTIDIPDITSDPFGQQQSPYNPYHLNSYSTPYQPSSYAQNPIFNPSLQQQQMMIQNGVPGHVMTSHMGGQGGHMSGVPGDLTTIRPLQGLGRAQSSPVGSNTTSPGRESSEESDDSLPLAQVRTRNRSRNHLLRLCHSSEENVSDKYHSLQEIIIVCI